MGSSLVSGGLLCSRSSSAAREERLGKWWKVAVPDRYVASKRV